MESPLELQPVEGPGVGLAGMLHVLAADDQEQGKEEAGHQGNRSRGSGAEEGLNTGHPDHDDDDSQLEGTTTTPNTIKHNNASYNRR